MMTEIWGMTPDALVLRSKIRPYPSREAIPSWMRAPPESLRPITGVPVSRAMSTLADLVGDDLLRLPPKTVKSSAKTKTGRPSMVP